METSLRKMGNSTGLIVPRAMLGAMGLAAGARLDVQVEDGKIVATPVRNHPREGWEEDAKLVAAAGITDEEADWMGFGNDGDDELRW